MILNLATINIFQNFLGKKVGFKTFLEKNKENMNIKEQNQTTAILAGLIKFNRKTTKLKQFQQQKLSDRYFTDILKIVSCDNITANN